MSAAINHVRLLAPEDFFAPIASVMKARSLVPVPDAPESEFRQATARNSFGCAANGVEC